MHATSSATLILGGGFGGIAAANTLRRLLPPDPSITVVERNPAFHVGAGKTWVMLGERTPEQISRPVADFWRGIRWCRRCRARSRLQRRLTAESCVISRPRWRRSDPGRPRLAEAHVLHDRGSPASAALESFGGGDVAIRFRGSVASARAHEAAMLLEHAFRRGLAGRARPRSTVEERR
jgi:hypothetical protein